MEIKKAYEKLKIKYNLPEYEELDEEFELLYFQRIIEIKYILRFVRRRIVDKLNSYVNFLQNILNPNPSSLISLEESKFFSQEEREEIIALIKEMVIVERKSLELDINHNEKKDAEFIKYGFMKWGELRNKIAKMCDKLKEGWESEIKEESEKHYFG